MHYGQKPMGPSPSFFRRVSAGIHILWETHPVLTFFGFFFLFVFVIENHWLEPLLAVSFFFLLWSFFSRKDFLQEFPAMQKKPPSPPPHFSPPFPPPMPPDLSHIHALESRLASLEKNIVVLQTTEEDLLKRTEHLGKPKSRSFLAIFMFCIGVGSLSIPLFFLASVAFWKYLGRPELSAAFLSAFNHLHLDHVVAYANFVDFDFFATFFGVLLLPSLTLLLIGFLVPIRILFKRQRGFLMAFVAFMMLFVSTFSFVGIWKSLMIGAHQWGNTLQQATEDHLEVFKQKLQSPSSSFGERIIAVKALKKVDTEDAYQILFESLGSNNAIIQQLIFKNLQNHLTLEQIPPLEKLLQQTPDRRFQHLGVELISTVPDKEVAYKLLEYKVPLSVQFLRERFTQEDIPRLQEKLYDPQVPHKALLLQALYSLDEENTFKILEVFTTSHEEESQRAVLQVIAKNTQNSALKPLLNKLIQSQFHSIHHEAKRLWRRHFVPPHKRFSQHPPK